MRSRALNLAALALLTGLCGSIGATVRPAAAQQLDAGKPPAQIFAGTCAACHRSPRGLVRSVAPGSLPSFLRQHYTTGNDMAGTMASYVLGNGGTQQVAEPPPKQEPKQRAKSDGQDVAARTPPAVDPKAQSKAAKQQKAGKKGQQEPSAATPPAQEPDKPEAKPDVAVAKPETPAAEPPKAETAAADCKVEPAKQADESKPPKQPAALLTLPGFPAPEPEPEPEPAAQSECEPAASPTVTAAARTDDHAREPAKDQATGQSQDQPKEQAKEQSPAAPPPALAEAPKSEPLRSTVTEAPALDIMREEVHAPRLVRPSQKKRAPPAQ
jgi:hypothetical protein